MGTSEWTLVGVSILAMVGATIGYLLSKRDEKQQEEIKDLYEKYKEEADKLSALELAIAKNHFEKSEVMAMFDAFKKYLDEKFGELKTSINDIHKGL